jgi:hypothetical protein
MAIAFMTQKYIYYQQEKMQIMYLIYSKNYLKSQQKSY